MNKKTLNLNTYKSPEIEMIYVIIEQGFANSTNDNWNSDPMTDDNNDINPY